MATGHVEGLDLSGSGAPKYTEEEDRLLAVNLMTLQLRVAGGEYSDRRLDTSVLCELHKGLFGGVRDHAGHCRGPDFGSEYVVFGLNRSVHKREVASGLAAIFEKCHQSLGSFLDNRSDPSYEEQAIRLAVWTHAEVVKVHPFQDGNGRTSRLILDAVLVRLGMCPVAPELPKQEYLRALNHYQGKPKAETAGDLVPLVDVYIRLCADQSGA